MRRYPEYKESGVEWIGEIPKHWTITRLKYVSKIPVTYGLNIEADRYTTEGIRLIRITDIDESGGLRQKGVYLAENYVPQEQMLNSYDLLLSRSGATVGKSYLHLEKGKYASAGYLVRFNFGDYWTSQFIYYVTLSHFYRDWLEQQIIISTIQNVNGGKYSNFQLPIPLHQEQHQIVNFLDHKTGQIDELLRIKERRIELLQEQRTALINQAVTKGLDPNVEIKPSGVEWIGEIPKHWRVNRLKYISNIVASYVDKHINPDEIQVDLCNYTDVYYHEKIDSSIDFMRGSCNQDEYERSLIKKGDIIITKDSESADDIGVPTFTQEELTNVVCGYHLSIIRPLNEVDGKFLFRFIQSKRAGRYFEVNATGITRFSLGKSIIENLSTLLPPLSEQRTIANFLDCKTQQIDELIAAEQRKIELLKEYRQSLISEAVTGKIDVRNEV